MHRFFKKIPLEKVVNTTCFVTQAYVLAKLHPHKTKSDTLPSLPSDDHTATNKIKKI